MVAFLSVVAFLLTATVVFDLAFVWALAGLLTAFLVSFALAFFGGTVAYLPPETFGASTLEFSRNLTDRFEISFRPGGILFRSPFESPT